MPGCLMPADIRSIHTMLAMTSLSVARLFPGQCRRTPADRPAGPRNDADCVVRRPGCREARVSRAEQPFRRVHPVGTRQVWVARCPI